MSANGVDVPPWEWSRNVRHSVVVVLDLDTPDDDVDVDEVAAALNAALPVGKNARGHPRVRWCGEIQVYDYKDVDLNERS